MKKHKSFANELFETVATLFVNDLNKSNVNGTDEAHVAISIDNDDTLDFAVDR